jgi:hypothetical protein
LVGISGSKDYLMLFHEVVDLRDGHKGEELEINVNDLIGRVVEKLKELVWRDERFVEPKCVACTLAQLLSLTRGEQWKGNAERAPIWHHFGEQLETGIHVPCLIVASYLVFKVRMKFSRQSDHTFKN